VVYHATAVVYHVTAVVYHVTAGVNIDNRERDWSVNRERAHFAAVGTYRSIERSRSIERCRPMKRRSLFKLSGYRSIGLRM
jgi:hypothetical protein